MKINDSLNNFAAAVIRNKFKAFAALTLLVSGIALLGLSNHANFIHEAKIVGYTGAALLGAATVIKTGSVIKARLSPQDDYEPIVSEATEGEDPEEIPRPKEKDGYESEPDERLDLRRRKLSGA